MGSSAWAAITDPPSDPARRTADARVLLAEANVEPAHELLAALAAHAGDAERQMDDHKHFQHRADVSPSRAGLGGAC
jgi:hypothetical protein